MRSRAHRSAVAPQGTDQSHAFPTKRTHWLAEWTKRTWDIDAYSPEQLLAVIEHMGLTPAEFKELPVYQMNVEKNSWAVQP